MHSLRINIFIINKYVRGISYFNAYIYNFLKFFKSVDR